MNDAAEFNSNISHHSQVPSELESKHKLQLTCETSAYIVREEIVVVVVEIVGAGNDTKASRDG